MTWTPPTGVTPVDRKPPTARRYDDIPAILDWLRGYYSGNTVLGVHITALDRETTYSVTAEPGYGTPGTFQNYKLVELGPGEGGGPSTYALSRYPGPAELLAAVPPGETAVLDGAVQVSASVTSDGSKGLSGRGIHGPLIGAAGLGTNPVVLIRPPADGNLYDLARYEQVFAVAGASGGDAVRVDLTGTRKMARTLFVQMFGRASAVGGYALNIVNENDAPGGDRTNPMDGFFCSTFLACAFNGGVRIRGGGDSLTFIASTITGDKAFDVELNTDVATHTEASQLMLFANNLTPDGGTIIRKGTRSRVIGNNVEIRQPGGLNYTGGMVHFLGSPATRAEPEHGVTYTEEIIGGTIAWNYLGSASERPCIELTHANLTQIVGNTVHMGSGAPGIVIRPTARNTILGPNEFRTAAGQEVADQGVGTMGIWKPMSAVALGAGVTLHPQHPGQFIKRPDALAGAVFLNGRLQGGGATEGSLLFALPEGFRPVAGRYPILPVMVRGTRDNVPGVQVAMTWVVVNPTGEVTLGQTLDLSAVVDVIFGGVSFESPLV